jgi:ArsR family metal-binding transcriptional regulator
MTLYPEKVYITQVKDTETGLELLQALTKAINTTWEHRAELVAMHQARRAPQWLDIWKMLPQTNCKECGEVTCMAFATSLVQQTRELRECLPLFADPAFADRQASLQAML